MPYRAALNSDLRGDQYPAGQVRSFKETINLRGVGTLA